MSFLIVSVCTSVAAFLTFRGENAFDFKNIFILLFYVYSYLTCMYKCASYSCLLSMEAGIISLTLWCFQDAIYLN